MRNRAKLVGSRVAKCQQALTHCILLLILLPLVTSAAEIKHVIYVTLDGVRWQEAVNTKKHLNNLWHKVDSGRGKFYGEVQFTPS